MSKRIIDLQTTSGLLDDDYIMVDGPTNETKKFPIKTLVDDIEALEAGTSLADGAVNTSAIHDGAVTNQKIAANSVSTSNLQNGAVTLEKIASGSDATQLASGLMSSSDKTKLDAFAPASNYALKSEIAGAYIYKGSVQTANDLPGSGQKVGDVYNIITASRYGQAGANVAWNGSGWDTLGETFEIADGVITSAKINDGAVTSSKLATNAVTADKITDLNVIESKLAAGSVTESKIGAGAVTATKIGTGAVESAKLATGAVITEKITDGAITTSKIDSKAVNTSKIADYAVDSLQIANNAVTSDKLSSNSVLTAKILDQAVTEGKIANGAVTEGKIGSGAVTEGKIGSNAVTEAKIATGAVSTEKLADGAVETGKLDDYSVVTAKLGDGAVTTQKIADSNVTTGKLANSAVTTAKIADSNVTTAKIADLNVTEGKLANGAVTTDKVADGAITRNKLNEEVTDELDFKADVDGYYTDMTVGASDNLTARGDAVEASFIRRTSGGVSDIESGNATIKSIKGNTIRWNQLVPAVNSSDWKGQGSATKTYNESDDSITLSSTSDASSTKMAKNEPFSPINGHKYCLRATIDATGLSNTQAMVGFFRADNGSDARLAVDPGTSGKYSSILIPVNSTYFAVRLGNATPANESATFYGINLFDLTVMFGAGNEPETVAEFEALYPEPYYAYDAGSLLPVTMTGIATDGFNQWDEEWELGQISSDTGDNTASTAAIRSKNYIEVFPNTEYYFYCGTTISSGNAVKTRFYDANKTYLGYKDGNNAYVYTNRVFVIPANAQYMRFEFPTGYGTTYNHDICINLSWSGRRNGEYEPYWSAQRAIDIATYFPTGLKKAGTVYDELTATEAIQRVGVVEVSGGATSTIAQSTDGTCTNVQVLVSGVTFVSNTSVMSDQFTNTSNGWRTVGLYEVKNSGSNGLFIGLPISVTTQAQANAWLAEHKPTFYYELATPITTPIDSINLTYKVDDWGTETITGPLGVAPDMDIIYGMNAVDTIRRLPDLYAGKSETEAALAGKADIDGYYSQMTVGAADNLTGRGDATTAEFLYRTAGGTADIETGQAVAKSVKGNTLVWNQLVNYAANTSTTDGVTFTNNSDGSWTINGTATNNIYKYLHKNANNQPSLYLTTGHVYLYKGCPTSGSGTTYMLRDGQNGNASDVGAGRIFTAVSTKLEFKPAIYVTNGTTVDNAVFRPQVFDLTQMFGAGNEPSTVAEFEALFPEPYYEYDAGSLLSVNMEGIETVGFNQWDEEWEVGGIRSGDGTNNTDTNRVRSKNYIPVFSGQTYYLKSPSTNAGWAASLFYYDASKAYMGMSTTVWTANSTKVMPSGTAYIRFTFGSSVNPVTSITPGTVCINLSWSGRRNGEYEAFWSSQRLIDVATYFPDGLRSAGSVYDELTSTEAITRVGVVDLGTLTWSKITSAESPYFSANFTGIAFSAGQDNFTCAKYDKVSVGSTGTSNGIYITNSPSIRIRDDAYTDAATFKTAMSGVMLYYELATPTVAPIDPALNLSYRVDDFGTERIMVPEDEHSAPPVLDIAYGLNVVDFVRRAPSEYMSHASFQQFCIALQTKLGIVITETWDDTDNRYEYSIADAPSS